MAIYCVRGDNVLTYRFNVLEKLKENGITTYTLTKKYGFSPNMVQKMREGNTSINAVTIDRLCGLLHCQPGDLLEYTPDDQSEQPSE